MADDVTPGEDLEGHRQRLRDRISKHGLSALADYELLEFYLFRSLRRKDTKKASKALIARFGSFSGVMSATTEDLCSVADVGPAVALELQLIRECALRLTRAQVAARNVISSWDALLTYVRVALEHETREQFRVLFLDRKNQLILDETMNQGTVDHAPVYPREIVRRALELSASALILVHNHPSGDPQPSRADVEITREVVQAAGVLKIVVHDHLVVGRHGVASFKALGLL